MPVAMCFVTSTRMLHGRESRLEAKDDEPDKVYPLCMMLMVLLDILQLVA